MDVSGPLGYRIRRTASLTRRHHALFLLLGAGLPLVLYLRTMPPTVYGLDSAELSVSAYRLGLVHAPGYPLYLLLGKLFTFLPIGDVGYRMNLMSAVFGVAASLLVQEILWRLTRQHLIALAAAWLLGSSWYFWTDAIVAEVYTLQAAFTAGLLLVLLVWRERQDPRWLYGFALLAGLSLVNYPATGLILPGLVAFIWMTDRRVLLSPRCLVLMGAAFGLGSLVYLYLPLRYLARPSFNYIGQYDATGAFHAANLTDPAVLWWVYSGGPFRGLMFSYAPGEAIREGVKYAHQLWGNFMAVGLPLGILGALRNWQRDRTSAVALTLMFASYTLFFVNYRVVDKHTMFLPSYIIWTVWIGWGYDALLDWAGSGWGPALQLACFAPVVVAVVVNLPLTDVSWDRRAYQDAAEMLDIAEPQALILGHWGSSASLSYLQLVEGRRPDVVVINRFFIPLEDLRALIDQEITRRPIYLADAEVDWNLSGRYRFETAGPGYRLLPGGSEARQ